MNGIWKGKRLLLLLAEGRVAVTPAPAERQLKEQVDGREERVS